MEWGMFSNEMCRVCMSVDSNLTPVFNVTGSGEDYSRKISELAAVQIEKSDGLPKKICKMCAHQLDAFTTFRSLIQDSDRKLRDAFNEQIAVESKITQSNDQVQIQLINAATDVTDESNAKNSPMFQDVTSSENRIQTCVLQKFDESCDTFVLQVDDEDVEFSGELHTIPRNIIINEDNFHLLEDLDQSEIIKEENVCYELVPTNVCTEMINQNEVIMKHKNDEETIDINKYENDNSIESNNNGESNDANCAKDNIVGISNDTITKVKEIEIDDMTVHFQCTLCLKNFPSLFDVLCHTIDMHVPTEGPYYCIACEKDCDTLENLKIHAEGHKGQSPYSCFLCNKSYIRKKYLKRHMTCHTDFPQYRCSTCGQRYKLKADLDDHVHSYHKFAPQYKCNLCPKVFNHKGNFKRHFSSHVDPNGEYLQKFPCSMCQRRFSNSRTLSIHMRVHTGERPYQCEKCGKAFSQQGNLINHVKIHTNPRSFTCDICGKSFNQKATLKEHKLLHSGEKPHVCQICGLAFTFSAAMRRHLWIHTDGGKPYKCDKCSSTFVGSYDLKRHMKIHQKKSEKKTKKSRNESPETLNKLINADQETLNTDALLMGDILLSGISDKLLPKEKENDSFLFFDEN
ncbi:hypothetical protein TKK_0017452 [Trichogramma kaykai]|uniref:Zinc finger protein 865 n=1 Tax=Trichogramma kaykai TaxID=54128 RepID=A0ABD2W2X4_9HYME